MTNQLTTEHALRVYSGRPGCMCGCRGTYRDDAASIKRQVNKMNKLIALIEAGEEGFTKSDGPGSFGERYVSIESPTRTWVIYYANLAE